MFGTSAPSVKIAIADVLVRKQTVHAKLAAIDQYRVLSRSEVVEQPLTFVHRRSRMKITCINPGLAEGVCQIMDVSQVHAKYQCRFASG
jgi:hypothetical protein